MLKVAVHKRRNAFSLHAEFEVPAPGVIALFGRSGCGKTTTVEIIAGLLGADQGRVELDGRVLEDASSGLRIPPEHRGIGYVFQDARLFPHFTVLGNLRYGQRRNTSRPTSSTLEEIVSLLGLQALLERRPSQLSGGERQRVALGRALLSQPNLLLLDEPLASLDVARREEVLPYLELLRDRLAIPMVYVSHQFDEVLRLATHMVLMESGRILGQGSLRQMSLSPQLRSIIGSDAVGAVVDGVVTGIGKQDLTELQLGHGTLRIWHSGATIGDRVRVQLLARDLILAIKPPHGLSVQNALEGTIVHLLDDDGHAKLVEVDVGGVSVLSRVTRHAVESLSLRVGLKVWVLVKAVSTRGRAFRWTKST